MFRTYIKPVRLNCGSYSSFEHCTLYICCPKNAVRINFVVLYCLFGISVNQFSSDFACLLETVLTFSGVVIAGGNVNFYVDKPLNNNTIKFTNLISSFNFSQIVLILYIKKRSPT